MGEVKEKMGTVVVRNAVQRKKGFR